MMETLIIENLSKKFGSHQVLDQLSFSVPEHSIYGFLGQNGAGKTTTMKIILGLLKADSGNIRVLGQPVSYGQTKTNRYIGYLPDVPEFYGYMRPVEYLKLCGEIAGLSKKEITKRSDELLELVGLGSAKKKIGGFSRGMKQRLGIAQALLTDPKLLICDEPTSALDPVGRKEILDILSQVKGKTTVLFSTHILSDAERICDQVAILHNSKLAIHGNLQQLKDGKAQNALSIQFRSPAQLSALVGSATMAPYQVDVKGDTVTISGKNIKHIQEATISVLHNKNLFPVKMELLEPSLENLFMEVVQ